MQDESSMDAPKSPSSEGVNLEKLLKLRIVVARCGELDNAKWWNTQGQLGKFGAAALRRGLPRTHYFAQARSVFAVAAHRCDEIFNPPGCVTLWKLPEGIEESFEARWEQWLERSGEWQQFFERAAAIKSTDLVTVLSDFDLAGASALARYARTRRSAEGRVVPMDPPFTETDEDVELLALGFARGEVGAPSVPYMKLQS